MKIGTDYIRKFGNSEFHHEAGRLLASFGLHDSFNYHDLLESICDPTFILEQNYSSFEFSDLPITLARSEHCFIDLYFWRRRPTTIHNHHFRGAFQCMTGNNSDSSFAFIPSKTLSPFHTLGELKLLEHKKISPGDIQIIDLQDRFIHQNHHHSDLTVNLCFRTPDSAGQNLSNFLYSGLKYEKDKELLGRVQRMLACSRIEEFDLSKIEIGTSESIALCLEIILQNHRHPKTLNLLERLHKKIQDELDVSILNLVESHEHKLDEIQDLYD